MTLALRADAVPDSPLARWDARWKLLGLLALAAGTAAVTRPGPAAGAMGVGLALAVLGRLPARVVLARLGLLALSSAPLLLLLPFTADYSAAAAFALRLAALGLFALVLARTGPVGQTFAAAGRLGVPAPLVQVALLAHRYTFLLAAEVRRTRLAWRVRGFRLTTSTHAYRTVGYSVGALAVRSEERAERVAAALRARGFDGTVRTLTPFRSRPADVLGFAGCLVATLTVLAADRLP